MRRRSSRSFAAVERNEAFMMQGMLNKNKHCSGMRLASATAACVNQTWDDHAKEKLRLVKQSDDAMS